MSSYFKHKCINLSNKETETTVMESNTMTSFKRLTLGSKTERLKHKRMKKKKSKQIVTKGESEVTILLSETQFKFKKTF